MQPVVTAIEVPFLSLVGFLVKLALATIPAGLIMAVIWFVVAAACGVRP